MRSCTHNFGGPRQLPRIRILLGSFLDVHVLSRLHYGSELDCLLQIDDIRDNTRVGSSSAYVMDGSRELPRRPV